MAVQVLYTGDHVYMHQDAIVCCIQQTSYIQFSRLRLREKPRKLEAWKFFIYRKQQILRSTKLSRFSWIFNKTRKFCLLISMAHSNMYRNLTKPRQFSLHYAKKPVNRESYVPRRICCLRYMVLIINSYIFYYCNSQQVGFMYI